uniref:F-box domain-containing protein n=1 Tax=Moniliophthora roreri TaxID=221103 RepID=A0A0W0EZ32_MONRR
MIPFDVWENIIQVCDRPTQGLVCGVCKLFRDISTPLLYRILELRSPKQIIQCLLALTVNTLAAESVQVLEVTPLADEYMLQSVMLLHVFIPLQSKAFQRLTNLKRLLYTRHPSHWPWAAFEDIFKRCTFPQLDGLTLVEVPITESIVRFIQRHDKLQILSWYTPVNRELETNMHLLLAEKFTFTRLKVLGGPDEVLGHLISNCPVLEIVFVISITDIPSRSFLRAMGENKRIEEFWFNGGSHTPGLDIIKALSLAAPHLQVVHLKFAVADGINQLDDATMSELEGCLARFPVLRQLRWSAMNEWTTDLPLRNFQLDQGYSTLPYGALWVRISGRVWRPVPCEDYEPEDRYFEWFFTQLNSGTYPALTELLEYLEQSFSTRYPPVVEYVQQFQAAQQDMEGDPDIRRDLTMDLLAVMLHLELLYYKAVQDSPNYVMVRRKKRFK